MTATVEGLFETADGAKISYSASIPAGEARGTVLCFNGAFFNLRMWEHASCSLTRAGVRVVAHDVRGAGLSVPRRAEAGDATQYTD